MRTMFGLGLAMAAALALPFSAAAQKKDTLTMGMVLEPPGLDPTTGAAAAIGEVVHYNILEGLTKIVENGEVVPLLAESWTISDDMKTYTFKLRRGVKFHDGADFDASDVKFSFERAGGEGSLNKRKAVFANMESIETPDAATVVISLKQPNPNLLFNLGENTGVIVDPASAETNATRPIGTGPFQFDSWTKGASVTMTKAPGFRAAGNIRLNRVTIRFINDPSAAVAAMLAGDVDAFPQFASPEGVAQFQGDPRFTVTQGTTEGETLLAMNNKRKPLDDVRVRRAITHAIDRRAIIDGAMYGMGTPIGSHFPPHHPAYVDLTGLYPHNPEKARELLQEAGVENLELSLKLPPPAYARRGGEIIAAQLAKVGIRARIENVEWAQWLDAAYKNKNYDLTVISHVEPLDIVVYKNPDYYFQYDSEEFRQIMDKAESSLDLDERYKYLEDAQRKLAEDAVNAYLFQLVRPGVYRSGVKGFWKNAPIFVNDLSAVYWE